MAQPDAPVIEGFTPSTYRDAEGFKNKFIRKMKENPFVPIAEPKRETDDWFRIHPFEPLMIGPIQLEGGDIPTLNALEIHRRKLNIGCLATAGALTYGLISFKQGKTQQSQMMMRTRIGAQGFTVVAILFGVVMAAMKPRDGRQ